MAYPVFAYVMVMVFIANPAAASNLTKDQNYDNIFTAPNNKDFVGALNKFFDQNLTVSNKKAQMDDVQASQGTYTNVALQNSFYITEHIDKLFNAQTIQFYVSLGTTSASTFNVEIKSLNISFDQVTSVTTQKSENTVKLTQPLNGSVDITITGVSTNSGDAIETLLASNVTTLANTSVASTSSYYHSYQYATTGTCETRYFNGVSWVYEYYSCTVTKTGWKTDTLSTIPAINVQNWYNITYQYHAGLKSNDIDPIYKAIYSNGALIDNITEGYAVYSSSAPLVAYNESDPNSLTNPIPLDQYLIGLLSYEGLFTTSFNANDFMATLMTFLQNPNPDSEPLSVWQNLENNFTTLMYPINGPNDPSHLTKYVLGDYYYTGNTLVHEMGLYQQNWEPVNQCLQWEKIVTQSGGYTQVCVQYSNLMTTQLSSVQLMGVLGLSTSLGFPSSNDSVMILKTIDMAGFPGNPYFFNWLMNLSTTTLNTNYPSSVLSALNETDKPIGFYTATLKLLNPYEAQVSLEDIHGFNVYSNLPVVVISPTGTVLGNGTVINGVADVTPFTGAQFGPNDTANITGNGFYGSEYAAGTITKLATTTNVSLVLNQNASNGTNPYVADVSVTDSNGNTAMGNLNVTVEDLNNNVLVKNIVTNGSAELTLPYYNDSVKAIVDNSAFYTGSSGTGTVQYDLAGMLQTMGPNGTDPVTNTRTNIIKNYIENSKAFDYNITSGYYTMTTDKAHMWQFNGKNVGYEVLAAPLISQQNVTNGIYNTTTFEVGEYYTENGLQEGPILKYPTGDEFFDFWLGMKAAPCNDSNNPPDMSYFEGTFTSLVQNYSTVLHADQSTYQSLEQDWVSQTIGLANETVRMGFPAVADQSVSLIQAFIQLINAEIQGLTSFVSKIFNTLLEPFFKSAAQFMLAWWHAVAEPVVGPAIAMVKNVVTILLNQIVNTVIQPMVNGQTTSLSTLFGGVSVDTIASYGPSVFSGIETTINSQSSQLASVGKTMGSMMSGLSVFSGAGTILGPLISMAGPGIMVTVMSSIASVVMDSVLTPLFSQFNSTVLSNDLDTLMAPLGGTSTGALTILDNIASLTSVTSQPGVVSQDSGSGYVTQSTGTSPGITTDGYPISSVGSTSSTCAVTAIGTCMSSQFNTELLLSQTLLDNSNGAFSPFLTVASKLITGMKTIAGSSSTTATTSTDYPIMLGILAAAKDLGGLLKTLDTTPSTREIVIQLIRIALDAIQLFFSVQFENQASSNVGSYLWVWKSTISTGNDLITLFDDYNIVTGGFTGYSFLEADLPFHQNVLLERVMTQIIGAIGSILIVSFDQSLIPNGKQGVVDLFTTMYVLQKGLKALLYVYRIMNTESTDKKFEQALYAISIGLNIGQYLSTLT